MTERTIEERLTQLETTRMAHGLTLRVLIGVLLPDDTMRIQLGDGICRALAQVDVAHAQFSPQVAMHEVEELFRGQPRG